MIVVKVDKLLGHEILAKHIVSETGKELISAGTTLKKEYIVRLKELGIDEVCINSVSKYSGREDIEILSDVVKEESIQVVKNVLEKHIYKNSDELSQLCKVADQIIDKVIEEKEILNQVTNIRQASGDLYTHSINVCALSTVLALKKGMKREIIEDIARGSLLHDIGLRCIVVPYENTNLNDLPLKDQIELKKHVIYGYDSIENVDWLSDLSKNIVLLHHERNDGSGYPFKNHGSSINPAIKIVAVCDVFESMISGVGYRQYKVYEAIEHMRQMSVKALDKEYVEILLRMVALYPVGTKVRTNEGEIGVVIRQNKNEIDRPIIKIIKDKNGNEISENVVKDLMEELTLFIIGVVE